MLGKYIYIDAITVKADIRGKGIGKALIRTFEKEARDRGAKYIHLTAPKFNEQTIKFYEKNRYDKGKEFIQFYKKL